MYPTPYRIQLWLATTVVMADVHSVLVIVSWRLQIFLFKNNMHSGRYVVYVRYRYRYYFAMVYPYDYELPVQSNTITSASYVSNDLCLSAHPSGCGNVL
jgi:hypothetical protein